MADGRRLPPFVVFKGVQPIAELNNEPGIIVAYSKNGWMNKVLTKVWVKQGWGTLSFGRRLLVWDAYECHLMDSVMSKVTNQAKSYISTIPGGLTFLVQPAYVSWNKPFKTAYKELYNEWMVCGKKLYTPGGNIRTPNGKVVAAAGRLIASKTKALHEPHDLDSADPFPDLDELNEENKDQVDTNEC
uniref:DDE-1 domain-containing protein n=1 Tax=Amphimedon queenslandica TaxID=400682 RepID=A0A1X7U1B0_AMPQE